MQIDHLIWVCWAACLAVSTASALFWRTKYSTSLALVMLSSTMLSFSYFGALIDSDLWSQITPPPMVSRATLLAIATIIITRLWGLPFPSRQEFIQIIKYFSIVASLLIGNAITVAFSSSDVSVEWNSYVRIILLIAMLLVALAVGYIERYTARNASYDSLLISFAVALCAAITLLGSFEVVFDYGVVKNTYISGITETRASSTFRNPNWFAFGLIPFLFAAIALSHADKDRPAFILAAFSAVGLVCSGSRSVISVFVAAVLISSILIARSRFDVAKMRKLIVVIGSGATFGIACGFIASILIGDVAFLRYKALLSRLLFWFPSDRIGSMESIRGRFIATSPDKVDSAIVYLFIESPVALIAMVAIFVFLAHCIYRSWRSSSNIVPYISYGVLAFAGFAGAIGQVYWAFPTWIIISVLLGWVITNFMFDDRSPQSLQPA